MKCKKVLGEAKLLGINNHHPTFITLCDMLRNGSIYLRFITDKNMNTDKTAQYKDLIITHIERVLPNAKIYLFGSRARKTHREGADIDIALDMGTKIDFSLISSIITSLEESNLPICFDIVDLHSVGQDLRREIEREGIAWKN